MGALRDTYRLGAAALLAFAALWSFGGEFANSVAPEVLDPAVGRPLPAPGSVRRFRSEGWGTTHYGEHGLLEADLRALRAAPPGQRLVGIWGDSFVEAAHVDDPEKFSSQYRRLAAGHDAAVLLAIGHADRDLTDVVELVPRYESLFDFDAEVLVLHDLSDVSPNGVTFIGGPGRHFVAREVQVPAPALRATLAQWRLDFVWPSWYRLVVAHRNPIGGEALHLHPGRVHAAETMAPDWQRLEEISSADWAYALDRLAASSSHPWTILYLPRLPFLQDGTVLLEHPAADSARRFAGLCAERGVDFVDLSPRLAAFYRRTHRVPFGFDNGRMSRGHLNVDGHRILAQALLDWSLSVEF